METDGKPIEDVQNGEDVGDVLPSPCSGDKRKKPGLTTCPVPKEALFYKMDHKRRGIAAIFNHENFDMPSLKSRTGTNADCENLENTLKILGFEVSTFYDLKSSEVDDVVTKLSEQDHSDCDCFVLALLSHGEQGIIYSRDSAYKPDSLWSKFTADLCPTLAGKPKLFFIQACQGDKLDSGITVHTQVDSSPTFKIPIHADFLIACSTIPGFYSWRNTSKGSWFIQALCLELKENGFTYDLLTLLTFVNRRVAVDFESYVPGFFSWRNESNGGWFIQALCLELNENGFTCDILTLLTFVNRRVAVDFESKVPTDYRIHAKKQIPCITYMLTRLLKFNAKPNLV